jgi:hypothetical protein
MTVTPYDGTMNTAAQLTATANRKRRWYQFSLRSLLIFVTVFGIACHWCARYYNCAKAREAFERSLAAYDCGQGELQGICEASAAFCQVQKALPFADQAGAQALHVLRLLDLEERHRAAIPQMMFATAADRDAALADVEKIHALRADAEEKLNVLLGK